VTVIDEGVTNGGYYYPFDDEGTKKRKTVVVKKGILKNFIHDRTSASKLGSEPTGNGRAMNFENSPIVRQTNYFMEPGDRDFDELIEDIDLGVYIRGKGLTGGEVEVGMGTFTFNVGPSQIIRKGELAETVRGVVISGLILETMKTIDAVGKDLRIRTNVFGGCGKNEQAVPVGFGGPHIRIRRMTVGGR
jgi:TldD protein